MQFNEQLVDLPNLHQFIDPYPLTISPDSYVIDAMFLMNQEESHSLEINFSASLPSCRYGQKITSCVLVVEERRLLGIFTLRDVLRVTVLGRDLSNVTMAEVMIQHPITLKQSEFQDISTALLLLQQYQIYHLPIVDDEEKLVGMVTESGLLQQLDLVKSELANQALQKEIKEKKETEAKLLKSEEIFRQFGENSETQIIWIKSYNNGETVYINPAYEKIFGRSCQSLRENPLSWTEAIHPEDRDRILAETRQNLQNGEPSYLEYRIIKTDGSIRWIFARVFPIKNAQGQMEYFGGIAEDISEGKLLEEARRESEAKFRHFANNSHALIWFGSLENGENLYVNPAYERIWGKCDNKSWLEGVHPDDRDRIIAKTERQMRRESTNEEYRIIRPDGSISWIWEQGFVIEDDQGKVYNYGGIAEDITERKLAEEALLESEERLNLAIASANMGIWERNLITDKWIWSDSIGPLYGLPEASLCPSHEEFFNLIYPQDRELCIQVINLAIEEKSKFSVEYRVIWPNGSIHWLSSTGKVYQNEKGEPVKIIGTTKDISKRKQKEQKLSEQAALLNIATDAIFVRDFQTEILFWNQGAEKIYGWQTREVVGKTLKDIFYSTKSPQPEVIPLQTVIKSGSWQGELRKQTKFGQEIIVESRWTLMFDTEGQPTSILIVDTDITQKKELEEQFYRAQRVESIGTLAGGIAHDINNILTPILGGAQILQGRLAKNQETHTQLLKMIENNARRGADLVKQILSFARGLKGERGIVQVKHLITDIRQIAQQTFPKSIKFTAQIFKDLWTVSGDTTQLHQVLMNLVVNAHDAMPEGGNLQITAENVFIDETYAQSHPESKVGNYIVITVIDTGMGMTPEILNRIFEPFFTTKEVGTGTGLGLSTVLGIVKSHEGFVTVTSVVGKGSTFKVFLPSIEVCPISNIEDLEIVSGQGELILVVDDEPQIREVAKIILEQYNYQTITASNGFEAIALYVQHQQQISVVLMDMMMPEMNGITAIRTLKKLNPQVQVIACSGLNTIATLAELADMQIQAVLSKPYTTNELLQNINQIIRK